MPSAIKQKQNHPVKKKTALKSENNQNPELSRPLSLFSLIMMGVGMMIGSGVFVASSKAIGHGGLGAVLIAFAINGLIALFTAMAYAELASAIPRAGGPYNWANFGLGPIFGFLSGWMEWLAAAVAGSLYAKTFAKPVSIVNNYVKDSNKLLNDGQKRIPKSIPTHRTLKYGRDVYRGIMNTIQEYNSKMIIMGWQGEKKANYYALGHTIDLTVENAACKTIVIKPALKKKRSKFKKIFLASKGGQNALLALKIACALAEEGHAALDIFTYKTPSDRHLPKNYEKLIKPLEEFLSHRKMQYSFIFKETENVTESIFQDSQKYNSLVLGSSEKGLFKKKVFDTIPEDVAAATNKELIMVKSNQGLKSFISRWLGA